jgi:ribosome biogenesis protein ENP2
MEMSFVPQTTGGDDEQDEYSGGTARKERGGAGEEREPRGKKVERFGAGLEKGGEEQGGEDLGTMQREGRSKRRDPGRSGSKNAFRRK